MLCVEMGGVPEFPTLFGWLRQCVAHLRARTTRLFTQRTIAQTLFLLVCLLCSSRSEAHNTSVVRLDVAVEGRTVDTTVRIAAEDMAEPLGLPPLWTPTIEQTRARSSRAARYLSERLRVQLASTDCQQISSRERVVPQTISYAFESTLTFECARQIDRLRIDYNLFFDLDLNHRCLATLRAPGVPPTERVLRREDHTLTLTARPSRWKQFAEFVHLGAEHIFTGYDHLAFVLTLLLAAAALPTRLGVRHAFGTVTAFTMAHSLTLAAAALDVVRLPSKLVESAIAASIAFVAFDNLRKKEPLQTAPRGRWPLTFLLGLIHGFGFASVLGELGLPQQAVLLGLLGFNVGVELGQLIVVAFVLPMLFVSAQPKLETLRWLFYLPLALGLYGVLVRFGVPVLAARGVLLLAVPTLAFASSRYGYDRGGRRLGSLVLVVLGCFWFLERVSGKTLLGGWLG